MIGQPEYISRSLAKVIRDAILYSGGPITISARNGDGVVTVTVADKGPGVPESEIDEIFNRFPVRSCIRALLTHTAATSWVGRFPAPAHLVRGGYELPELIVSTEIRPLIGHGTVSVSGCEGVIQDHSV